VTDANSRFGAVRGGGAGKPSRQPSPRAARNLGIVHEERNEREEYDNEAEQVQVVSRDDFVARFAQEYTPSHCTFIGPTQRGKTTLCFQLLGAIMHVHPKWRVIVLHGKIKGRDHTMEEWAKKNNYRVITRYPPSPTWRPSKAKHRVKGYILRPLKKDDIPAAEEEKILKTEYAKALRKNYHYTGKEVKITLVDERAQADKDLRLTDQLDAPLQRGLPHNPEWNNIQRGAWVSYHCYDAPEHMFIYHDDHESNRKRYSEFGCADPEVIFRLVSKLQTKKVKTGGTISQCLYMRRSDRYMCIVDT
jgi:hypothetical protein